MGYRGRAYGSGGISRLLARVKALCFVCLSRVSVTMRQPLSSPPQGTMPPWPLGYQGEEPEESLFILENLGMTEPWGRDLVIFGV